VALLGRRRATLAQVADLPLAYASDYRPIPASTIQVDPTGTDGGRTHVHANDGTMVQLAVIPAEVLDGRARPGAASALVATGPVIHWEEQPLADLYFVADSAVVPEHYRPYLENAAAFLTTHPGATLELRGYTDLYGTAIANASLAERRGTAVKDLLVRVYGVPPERVQTTAVGADFASASDAEARRVEVRARVPQFDSGPTVGEAPSTPHP
jgi:outer membrane protein OmpA-like peptidoglycan-associated protein